MKTFTSAVVFMMMVFIGGRMVGQNLVPNQSFESYDTCPEYEAQIARANGWSIYSQAGTTPDYYNACDTGGQFCVPNGDAIHQPAKDGSAYAAIVTWDAAFSWYREHIGIQLIHPLVVGQKYFLSFFATRGGAQLSSTPSNNIGMLLSTVAYSQSNPSPINNLAHLYSNAIITDTINWTHIKGTIVADSAYDYVILGNFFDDAHTDTIKLNSFSFYSYYGVDDICISIDSLTCFAEHTGITEVSKSFFSFSPNPVQNLLTINFHYTLTQPGELMVYDALGRKVKSYTLAASEKTFELSVAKLPAGVYLVAVNSGGQVWGEMVVKE